MLNINTEVGMDYYLGYIICGVVILIAFLVSLVVQSKVTKTYDAFKEEPSSLDLTGAELARRLATENGLNLTIKCCKGKLTDHYNPKEKSINISEGNFNSKSISAQSIVAHEFGHALQHAQNYGVFKLRQAVVKVSNFVSGLLFPIIIIGLILELVYFATAGRIIIYIMCGVYGLSVLAGLVTLPVEYNASSRAKKLLFKMGLTSEEEQNATAQLLNSAALTYVASLFVTLAYFLRIVFLLLASRRD